MPDDRYQELLNRISELEQERDFEQSSRLTSEAQLGTQIDNLLRERGAREKQVRAETIESCAKIAVKVQYSDPEEAGACAAFEIAKSIRALASKEGGNA